MNFLPHELPGALDAIEELLNEIFEPRCEDCLEPEDGCGCVGTIRIRSQMGAVAQELLDTYHRCEFYRTMLTGDAEFSRRHSSQFLAGAHLDPADEIAQ